MTAEKLRILEEPNLHKPRILLGLSGWMDGGDVSTGSIKYLVEKLSARRIAEIDPEGFYIYNIPGSMEISALFRPHTRIRAGLVTSYENPENIFYADEQHDLILFLGKEPNLAWQTYAECIFSLCRRFDAGELYFIGSVAGLVPHTRQPRISCSVSDLDLRKKFEAYKVKFAHYEGPASLTTYLLTRAAEMQMEMATFVAEIPAYVQGYNPKCIDTVLRWLSGVLDLNLKFDELRTVGEEFEKRLSEIVEKQPELAEKVQKLEEDYDNEVFNREMSDLKNWLEGQGIRLD